MVINNYKEIQKKILKYLFLVPYYHLHKYLLYIYIQFCVLEINNVNILRLIYCVFFSLFSPTLTYSEPLKRLVEYEARNW
jgi:hypothetical protein